MVLLRKNGKNSPKFKTVWNDFTIIVKSVKMNATEVYRECQEMGYIDPSHSKSALLYSALTGNMNLLKACVQNGRHNDKKNINKALKFAVVKGHYECCKFLLENGAKAGSIALDSAIMRDYKTIVSLLFSYGALPRKKYMDRLRRMIPYAFLEDMPKFGQNSM